VADWVKLNCGNYNTVTKICGGARAFSGALLGSPEIAFLTRRVMAEIWRRRDIGYDGSAAIMSACRYRRGDRGRRVKSALSMCRPQSMRHAKAQRWPVVRFARWRVSWP